MGTSLRAITFIIVSIFSVWLMINSIKIAIADLLHYRTKAFIEHRNNVEKTNLSQLLSHQKNIEKIIKLNPINAQYYDYLARLYYLEALNKTITNEIYIEKIELAYQNNLLATKLRPQWSHSWSNMALMKSLLQQYDIVFIYSINQARKYGAWEIANNEAILQAGFNIWFKTSNSMKEELITTFQRLYLQSKQAALTILEAYSSNLDICNRLLKENDMTYNKNIKIICR
jgi:hypothetical protein